MSVETAGRITLLFAKRYKAWSGLIDHSKSLVQKPLTFTVIWHSIQILRVDRHLETIEVFAVTFSLPRQSL